MNWNRDGLNVVPFPEGHGIEEDRVVRLHHLDVFATRGDTVRRRLLRFDLITEVVEEVEENERGEEETTRQVTYGVRAGGHLQVEDDGTPVALVLDPIDGGFPPASADPEGSDPADPDVRRPRAVQWSGVAYRWVLEDGTELTLTECEAIS